MSGRALWICVLLGVCAGAWSQDAPKVLVFPQPVKMDVRPGAFAVSRETRIVLPAGNVRLRAVAELLSAELGRALGAPDGQLVIEETEGPVATRGNIAVNFGAGDLFPELKAPGSFVCAAQPPQGALIAARDAAGCYYGALVLLQLFTATGEGQGEFQGAEIVDGPYHQYRGSRSILPRGKPRPGEITHEYYRNLLRLWGFCRLNHVWVQGCSWNTPMRRHPELGWVDELTAEQAKEIVDFASRHFLSMDGSVDSQWLYYKYKHLAEIPEGETWETLSTKVRKMNRVNPCPSNPETLKLMLEQIEDTTDVLPGDHFAVPMDEMYQEYNGSRWGVCPLCKGKDPVKLWADFTNALVAKVLEKGKTPILGGGMLMREHQGWYKDIYKAIDLVKDRDRIVIYNWSEGHIRRGAMVVDGKRLVNATFSATPFFKEHGYKDVVHLFAGTDWQGRPEMREVKGKLDCYGGFVSYYHDMNYVVMKERGTIARLVFTAQHLWSPDSPPMDSPEERKMQRYGEALADAICRGKTYVEAIDFARKAHAAPEGTQILTGGAMGRGFASADAPVNLMGAARGDRTEGVMKVVLPVEEANPDEAYLVLTINDWDQSGEGQIFVNGHEVKLDRDSRSNGRDFTFPPIRIAPTWLKFGPEPNEVKFVYRSTAGFIVKKVEIVIADAPGK